MQSGRSVFLQAVRAHSSRTASPNIVPPAAILAHPLLLCGHLPGTRVSRRYSHSASPIRTPQVHAPRPKQIDPQLRASGAGTPLAHASSVL